MDLLERLVTHNVLTISDIPKYIKGAPQVLEVRGEVYLRISEFEKLNKKAEQLGEKTYVNPRNAAAGSIRQKNSAVAAQQGITLSTKWVEYLVDLLLSHISGHSNT